MITITLSPKLLSEIEPLAVETHQSIDAIVNAAVIDYLRLMRKRKLREQRAKQYAELAAMWHELAEDIADEKWLPVENESLHKFEKRLAK